MTEEVTLRPVRGEDAEAVYAMRLQPLVLRYTTARATDRIGHVRQFLDGLTPFDHLLVAELDGRAVAMAGLHGKRAKEAHSATFGIMVHDAYANRGIGRLLAQRILALADGELGYERIELDVHADNLRAIEWYRRLG